MIYPSLKDLRGLLSYDPASGMFTWLKKPNRNIVVGSNAGYTSKEGYVKVGINGKKLLAHRLAWLYMTGSLPDQSLDHINGRRGDNRWVNLRLADIYQQAHNEGLRKSNSTGRKGVYRSGSGYCASIRCRGSDVIHLGSFESLDEAAHAYNKAAIRFHGDFARLNPIGDEP